MSDLTILSRHRRLIFDSIPKLNADERLVYINVDIDTRKYLRNKKTHRQVGYLLHRAYFQAKGRFFDLKKAHKRDTNAASKHLNLRSDFIFDCEQYSATLQNQDKQAILADFGWSAYKANFSHELADVARSLVARRYDTERILFSLLDYCWKKRVTIPSYATLSKIVTDSMREYESVILDSWERNSNDLLKQSLNNLVYSRNVPTSLTELKSIDQDDSLGAMVKNATLLCFCREIFLKAKASLDHANLRPEGIRHFSDQISRNDLAQLRRQKDENRLSLNVACFIQDQVYQRQDTTLIAFQKVIRNALNIAKKIDLRARAEKEEDNFDSNRLVVNSVKQSRAVLREIQKISKDSKKTLSQKNEQVVRLVEAFFGDGDEDDIDRACSKLDMDLINIKNKKSYYHQLFNQHKSLIRKLSPALRSITFDEKHSDKKLLEAIDYFNKDNSVFDESTPFTFLKENEKKILLEKSDIPKISKWKLLLFIHVIFGIRDKKLVLKYSYKFRINESYLIPEKEWLENKENLIKRANLDNFKNGKSVLEVIGKNLGRKFSAINKLIEKGEIEGFQEKSSGWRLRNLEADYDASKFIPTLLNNDKAVTLYELLAEVDKYTKFSQSLKGSRTGEELSAAKTKQVYAAIMSLGTNLGHHNMSRSARNITEKQLRDIEKKWLSSSSLARSNEAMVSFIQSLSLPKIYHSNDGELFSSSDGKKITVAVNSLLANFSYKYYGKEQGITANSFVDDSQAFFNINIHASSDREAASMLDGMVESTRVLYPENETKHWHSTDQHGFTHAIFAGMFFINVDFAPRFPKIHKQSLWAYDQKTKLSLKGKAVAPTRVINRKKILQQWDNILHLMASIKLGYCSAAHMFRALSAQSPKSDLYIALESFGQILKSSYILSYLESTDLRRSVQKQLNRVEHGQKLSEAVFFARQGKLMVGSESEIQKSMMCKTLLKNAIIIWNYLFLSDYCCQIIADNQRQEVIDSISRGSVIAWAHINLHGVYDFDRAPSKSFKSTIAQMRAIDIQTLNS